jgi:cyclophilin family peptidyl-prolyl cis-trans isomerase
MTLKVAVLTLLLAAGPALADPWVARFSSVAGDFDVLLDSAAAPKSVENFIAYANQGLYDGTFLHRSTTYNANDIQIIQGGGYGVNSSREIYTVPTFSPIALEAGASNRRGTLAMARQSAPDTATSQWFFNLRDNSSLDPSPGNPGYAVFGRVLGGGMRAVDLLGSVRVYGDVSPFPEWPLYGYDGTNLRVNNLLFFYSVRTTPFRVSNISRSDHTVRVDWTGISTNTAVFVERTTNLNSGPWTVVSSNNTNGTFTDTDIPAAAAFYRVVVP